MPQVIAKAHIGRFTKLVTALFSVGTAGVTIFTFARSYGLIGTRAPAVLTVGSLGVSWVSLSPAVDTATSIGDTLRLAATVTDDNGTALIGATIRWSSDDPTVAEAIGAGKVVARRPGSATVVATAGDKLARARVVVAQKIASLRVNGDSVLTLGEDERRRVSARAMDARGNWIPGRHASWRSLDSSIVAIDSTGLLAAHTQGTTDVLAEVDGITTRLTVAIVPSPGRLDVLAGDAQRASAGSPLPAPVAVRLVSTRGQPISGAYVRFRTLEGRGTTDPTSALTDSRGVARTTWTLASLAGRQRLFASNEQLDSATVITAEAEPVAADTRLRPVHTRLIARAGQTISDTVRVSVTDSVGRPLADVPVEWSTEDGGRIMAVSARTDSLGEARALWTLGPIAGAQHARLRVGSGRSLPALVLGATATAGPAAQLIDMSHGERRAHVGTALHGRITVRVLDAEGNGVPDVTVAGNANGGELADTTVHTDSAGLARFQWTMPRTAGTQHLTLRTPGVDRPVVVSATAVADAAANIVFTEPKAAPLAGKRLGKSVDATVSDVFGNPIAGAVVRFTASGGSVAPAKVATDAAGTVHTHWTLGSAPGDQTLFASVLGGDGSVRSALTVHAAAPAHR